MFGKRLKYFRIRKNLTQYELGVLVGFNESNASIRIVQYEAGKRIPRERITLQLARVLGVCTHALTVPDMDTPIGIIHTSFLYEDMWGMEPAFMKSDSRLHGMICEWEKHRELYKRGEITKDEYDSWRYNYTGEEQHVVSSTCGHDDHK